MVSHRLRKPDIHSETFTTKNIYFCHLVETFHWQIKLSGDVHVVQLPSQQSILAKECRLAYFAHNEKTLRLRLMRFELCCVESETGAEVWMNVWGRETCGSKYESEKHSSLHLNLFYTSTMSWKYTPDWLCNGWAAWWRSIHYIMPWTENCLISNTQITTEIWTTL